ncbi:hypothetical protein CT676_37555 [Bradyrhizobium sp. MOS001]|uniref:hypothetical protein n=1 Tax=Bradyrhizobium sp. MOS001 TaxID=2133948 RepID=UPI00107578C8|nr:hypothetical protein [Bradyrhizobium sp. MOS001]TFW56013.1 hypothetical protein CT676_37555 [Bradyrhizobium sp. MOS001]
MRTIVTARTRDRELSFTGDRELPSSQAGSYHHHGADRRGITPSAQPTFFEGKGFVAHHVITANEADMLALVSLYWLRLGRGKRWRSFLGVDTAFCFLERRPSANVRVGCDGGFVLVSALLHG